MVSISTYRKEHGDTMDRWHNVRTDPAFRRLAKVIKREARSSIRLTAHATEHEDEIPIGASKLGGAPDLPAGYDWPLVDQSPLDFVAQINFAETAPYDLDYLLPTSGWFHVFFDNIRYSQFESQG